MSLGGFSNKPRRFNATGPLSVLAAFVLLAPVLRLAHSNSTGWVTVLALCTAGLAAALSRTGRYLVRGRALSYARFPLTMVSVATAAFLTGGLVFVFLILGMSLLGASGLRWGEAAYGGAVTGSLLLLAAFFGAQKERTSAIAEAQKSALLSELRAREAELQALQAQVSPHFLFNSLNSVAALTRKDPGRAYQMCIALAELLQERLGSDHEQWVRLDHEITTARRYLEIEKLRFGARLVVVESIDDETLGLAVPRLVLQPLIENAIKHGVSQLSEVSTIRLNTALRTGNKGRRLHLVIENPVPQVLRPTVSGHGLTLIRERVALLTEGVGSLQTELIDGHHRAELVLPVRSLALVAGERPA
jgi:two-component system, LytTR family, sensor histidine kinase AlgZ